MCAVYFRCTIYDQLVEGWGLTENTEQVVTASTDYNGIIDNLNIIPTRGESRPAERHPSFNVYSTSNCSAVVVMTHQ